MNESTPGASGLQVAQLASMAELYPEAVGYRVVGAGHLTFGEWDRQSNQLARGLSSSGVGPGDRVAIWLAGANALRWVTAYAAIHKAGAAAVPLDARLAPAEVAGMLDHAGAVAVFADEERVGASLTSAGGGPSATGRLVVDASGAGETSTDRRPRSWVDLLDSDGSGYQVPVEQDGLSEILFTSGTTGHPKGVAIRHVNASTVPNSPPTWSGSLWLHASPLATFAGISFVFTPMKLGMTTVYQPKFDAGEWLDFVEAEAPTAVFLVPAMVQLLLGHPRFDRADLSSIAICSVGSAPLSPAAIDRLQAADARCHGLQ